jgi:hypothetical protein
MSTGNQDFLNWIFSWLLTGYLTYCYAIFFPETIDYFVHLHGLLKKKLFIDVFF